MGFLAKHYAAFFERNIFERIIIYALLSSALVKLIFELALGQWGFAQAQNKQWFFYSFLMLDYALGYKKLLNFRVTFNPQSAFAILLLVMVAHGLFVGIYSHNQIFVIFNDLVPPLMIALNILRMQSSTEAVKEIDCYRLLRETIVILMFTSLCSLLAFLIGNPTMLGMENSAIFFPLLFAVISRSRNVPAWILSLSLILVALSLTDMNRTSMVFILFFIGYYLLQRAISSPVKALGMIAIIGVLGIAGFMAVPKESKTYARIVDLADLNFEERTGSIGERQAEMDAVQTKLDRLGPDYVWLGMGFGGVYEVARTFEYLTNYGHAHYSWVWFNMRFGKVGQIYLLMMMSLFVYNAIVGFRHNSVIGCMIAFMNILCFMYCFTYVNAVFLLSGIQFLHLKNQVFENQQKKIL